MSRFGLGSIDVVGNIGAPLDHGELGDSDEDYVDASSTSGAGPAFC